MKCEIIFPRNHEVKIISIPEITRCTRLTFLPNRRFFVSDDKEQESVEVGFRRLYCGFVGLGFGIYKYVILLIGNDKVFTNQNI